MEIWDLYDKDRKPLGRTHERGTQFNDGEYYVCAEVWVMNSKGELLTTKRHPNKKAGNLWEFVSGGALAGESTLASAIRELFEETGIVAEESELKLMATYANRNYFHDIYLLHKDVSTSEIVLQPDEAIDAKWADEMEIKRMIEVGEFVHSVGSKIDMYRERIK